jgi:aryl-alcohol dehydrogenase-like predicted oxidoreductase
MAIVDRAMEAGINFVDTADGYGRGKSEEILGKALKRNGKRATTIVATKVHAQMSKTDPNSGRISRRHVIEGCEASLRRLQTEWIDLYQLHRSTPEIPIDETLRALDDLIRAGKVRYIGTSTFPAWKIIEGLWVSKELGLNRYVCEQPPYNLLDRRPEAELIPMAQSYGIGLIPWSPLAGGFLTGKYAPQNPQETAGRMGQGNKWMADHFVPRAFAVVDTLKEIATELGATTAQVALGWVAQQPGITCPIIGPRTIQQLQDNLGAMNLKLSDQHLKKLDEVSPPRGMIVEYYWSGTWGPHLNR